MLLNNSLPLHPLHHPRRSCSLSVNASDTDDDEGDVGQPWGPPAQLAHRPGHFRPGHSASPSWSEGLRPSPGGTLVESGLSREVVEERYVHSSYSSDYDDDDDDDDYYDNGDDEDDEDDGPYIPRGAPAPPKSARAPRLQPFQETVRRDRLSTATFHDSVRPRQTHGGNPNHHTIPLQLRSPRSSSNSLSPSLSPPEQHTPPGHLSKGRYSAYDDGQNRRIALEHNRYDLLSDDAHPPGHYRSNTQLHGQNEPSSDPLSLPWPPVSDNQMLSLSRQAPMYGTVYDHERSPDGIVSRRANVSDTLSFTLPSVTDPSLVLRPVSPSSQIPFSDTATSRSPSLGPEDDYDTEGARHLRNLLHLPPGASINLFSLADPPPGEKPNYSLPTLIKLAIFGSPKKKLTLQEIYTALEDRFQWFKDNTNDNAWKNSIRHNLSLRKCFLRVQRPITEPGKGSYWMVDVTQGEGNKRIRKRNKKPTKAQLAAEQVDREEQQQQQQPHFQSQNFAPQQHPLQMQQYPQIPSLMGPVDVIGPPPTLGAMSLDLQVPYHSLMPPGPERLSADIDLPLHEGAHMIGSERPHSLTIQSSVRSARNAPYPSLALTSPSSAHANRSPSGASAYPTPSSGTLPAFPSLPPIGSEGLRLPEPLPSLGSFGLGSVLDSFARRSPSDQHSPPASPAQTLTLPPIDCPRTPPAPTMLPSLPQNFGQHPSAISLGGLTSSRSISALKLPEPTFSSRGRDSNGYGNANGHYSLFYGDSDKMRERSWARSPEGRHMSGFGNEEDEGGGGS